MAQSQEQHPQCRRSERERQLIEIAPGLLKCAYLSLDRYKEHAAQWHGTMLGTLCFTSLSRDVVAASLGAPFARVPMPSLEVSGAVGTTCEVWCAEGSFSYGQKDNLCFGHNEDILFGSIQLSEMQFDTAAVAVAGKTPLQQAAETAYRAIFTLIDELEFPHVLRFWNYIANINTDCHGMERYRQFNTGRQDGFLHSGRQIAGSVVPAASAVGCDPGPLTVYFLASRGSKPIAIENPRQVSAYHYPVEYGPRAPTFSRASVARLGGADVLFLSGTASIVGHKSVHVNDVVGQVRETIANIAAMVDEANRVAPQARFVLDDLCYKVYVRNPNDVVSIHQELRRRLSASTRILYLRADICRHDLLVEIEASAGHPMEFA
jgi:chorismate lyase/3-hydroxybenzoate synthase